jgi:serine/threonine protein kinase
VEIEALSRTCPECHNQYEDEILHCPEDGLDLRALDPDDELIGRAIGSYTVTKMLGKGGMGSVYMGEHPVIGSRVAIKFLHPQYSTDRKIVDRFFNEARAVNVIGHDNILKILDLNVTEDNRHYFVMEFLSGKPLQDLVQPDVPMPLEAMGPILLQVCEALQAAHDVGIVHRDLKPDNVYLTVHKGKKNFVKVVDFGIAKVTDDAGQSTGKTQTGMVMGTPAYMSPEQAGGLTSKIDARSDVYSLGCMMFQMATGRLPFPGTSFGEVLIGHLQLQPPRPRELAPAIPEAVEAIVLKCLEKKQEDRYPSMRAVHDAIAAVLSQLGISAELPAADAAEIAAAGGTRTRSSPGGVSRTPRPLVSRPTHSRKTPTPQTPRPQVTVASPPQVTAPPQRSRAGLFVGLAVGAIASVGAVGWFVVQQGDENRRAAERAARTTAERVGAEDRAAQKQAAVDEQQKQLALPVSLSVVSEPLGATVEATWIGGAKAAATPFDLTVPHNAKVHFAFSKKDYVGYATEVVADAPQVIRAQLIEVPKAPPPRVVRKVEQADKKATPAKAEAEDTIPIEIE